jgi:hypothetical protein
LIDIFFEKFIFPPFEIITEIPRLIYFPTFSPWKGDGYG